MIDMTEEKKSDRIHRRNDILLIALLLVVSATLFVYLFVFRKSGNTVEVTVDGKLYGTYSLSGNMSHDIVTGKDGEGLNRFVIEDGKVYMEYASCPDGICVSHPPVFRDGQSIVCLPNRVVVTVVSETDDNETDIVA